MAVIIDFLEAMKRLRSPKGKREAQEKLFKEAGAEFYNPNDPREDWYHEFDEGEGEESEEDEEPEED